MTPAIYDFDDHLNGDTLDRARFTVTDTGTGDPIDLTGATVKSEFRRHSKTGEIMRTFSDGEGITVSDAVNGVLQIDSFIPDWGGGKYYYDIQFTFPDNDPRTYITGTIILIQDVTQ